MDGYKPFGPAATLKSYLNQTGWSLDVDGTLDGPDYLQCNLLNGSCKYLSKTVRLMWNRYILTLLDRKGVGDFLRDAQFFHSVFSKLVGSEQNILRLNVTGAFQTQSQKSKWDPDCPESCELCDGIDTREHRLLECSHLEMIRT